MQSERSFESPSELGPTGTASPASAAIAGISTEAANRREMRILGLRRRFLVDRRSQIRAGLLTSGTTLILLILLNLSLFSSREQSAAKILADAPELAALYQSQNHFEFVLVLASSLVFLIGVFVVTVLETHKTAGAAFNLSRHMDDVRQGQYNTRIHLRHDDTLLPLGETFNSMTMALETRVWQEVEALGRFADRAERLTGPGDAEDLSREIRARADEFRRLAE